MLKATVNVKHVYQDNGFFVEAGAGDGELISNSLYFENKYQVKQYIYSYIYT